MTPQTCKETEIHEITYFAEALPSRMQDVTDVSRLATDLRDNIQRFPVNLSKVRKVEFDARGTSLWNLATRLERQRSPEERLVTCLLRAFAFYLLDVGYIKRNDQPTSCIRLLKVAHRAAKVCMDNAEEDLSVKISIKAAHYVELLENASSLGVTLIPVVDRLKAEHHVLRLALAWKQSKLDIAELMFTKVAHLRHLFNDESSNLLIGTLFEIGRDLNAKQDTHSAIIWLKRAYDIVTDYHGIDSVADFEELKISIAQLLIKVYTVQQTPQSTLEAEEIVTQLEAEFPNRMVISLLKLEMLAKSSTPDVASYSLALNSMIRTAHLTQINFKIIIHHLHKLKAMDLELAIKTTDQLLRLRLYTLEHVQWLERTTVMRVWYRLSSPLCKPAEIRSLFDEILERTGHDFSTDAVHAIQTMIWQTADKSSTPSKLEEADCWFLLALHPLLKACSQGNQSKIQRRLIRSAIARREYGTAQETYDRMPDQGKQDAQTQALMYQVAALTNDEESANARLEAVCSSPHPDLSLINACLAAARLSGNKCQTIAVLQRVLQNSIDENLRKGLRVPALLRSLAKLLHSELPDDQPPSAKVVEELCDTYEKALEHVMHTAPLTEGGDAEPAVLSGEIEWFAGNCFNLIPKLCRHARPDHVARLTKACSKFLWLANASAGIAKDQNTMSYLRQSYCILVRIVAYITLARSSPIDVVAHQYYSKVLDEMPEAVSTVHQSLISERGQNRADLLFRYYEILKFKTEACLRLQLWDKLDTVYRDCWKYDDPQRLENMADLAIIVCEDIAEKLKTLDAEELDEEPIPKKRKLVNSGSSKKQQMRQCHAQTLSFLRTIVDKTWTTTADLPRLCRWLRCLFQISLAGLPIPLNLPSTTSTSTDGIKQPTSQTNNATALQFITQAITIAAANRKTFPATELEWMATTAFNKAVDAYNEHDDDSMAVWAEKALDLAKCANDKGALLKFLRDGYRKMGGSV